MAKYRDDAQRIKDGLSPSEIVREREVTFSTIFQNLFRAIGEGIIRKSDVVFTIPLTNRNDILDAWHSETFRYNNWRLEERINNELKRQKIKRQYSRPEVEEVIGFYDLQSMLGDMYYELCKIEQHLHSYIRHMLNLHYPVPDDAWWTRGVPVQIRVKCAEMREADDERLDLFCYTTFINLSEIFDKQWNVLSKSLPDKLKHDKKSFLSKLGKTNKIRNKIMHPVKGIEPTQEEFTFMRALYRSFFEYSTLQA